MSSTMVDLTEERRAARDAIAALGLQPVLVEGPGASTKSPKAVTLSLVSSSDIYVGIFWERYGSGTTTGLSPTEMEYQRAKAEGKPILIYTKNPAPHRDRLLARFINELEQYDSGHLRATFADASELGNLIRRDLITTLIELATTARDGAGGESRSIAAATDLAAQDLLEFKGVLDLLRDRVVKRVVEQLDPSVKRFKTMEAVEEGLDRLAQQIDAAEVRPELVLGWRNTQNLYRGSELVAELLASRLRVPFKVIEMDEVGERRSVISDCRALRDTRRVLVVDDACYSGNTLTSIAQTLRGVVPDIDIRFAVLTRSPRTPVEPLYFAAEHTTGELLFPWGWSRHIVGFYDILRLFGISDRRVVVRDVFPWGTKDMLASSFAGSIAVDQVVEGGVVERDTVDDDDVFLYVAGGRVTVAIGVIEGEFSEGEYLFLPRGVAFRIIATTDSTIVRLTATAEQRDRQAVRLALSRGASET